jgi:hypothetical protein
MLAILPPLAAVLLASQPAAPAADPDAAFARLLAAAKAEPGGADFTALRLAYAETSRFDPGASPELDTSPVEHELKNGERAAAAAALDRIMDGRWTDARAHAAAAALCERMKDEDRSSLHREFERGLLDSILETGDGRSFETAWKAVTVADEEAALGWLRLGGGGSRAMVERDGRRYHVHTFRDEQIGREIVVHFDLGPTREPRP